VRGVRVHPAGQVVAGRIPARPRSDHNPLNRKEYLLHVQRRVTGQRGVI
jgi:ribosomal protection tetracycline resistance protein